MTAQNTGCSRRFSGAFSDTDQSLTMETVSEMLGFCTHRIATAGLLRPFLCEKLIRSLICRNGYVNGGIVTDSVGNLNCVGFGKYILPVLINVRRIKSAV